MSSLYMLTWRQTSEEFFKKRVMLSGIQKVHKKFRIAIILLTAS